MRGVIGRARTVLTAFTRASTIWSTRLKHLKMWKFGIVMALFGAIMIATSHMESYTIGTASGLVTEACTGKFELLPNCLVGLTVGWGMGLSASLGVLAAILLIVYAYTYLLKGISAYLPWYVSMGITALLFVIGRFQAPVDHLLVSVLMHLYPEALQSTYLAVATWGSPVASVLMKVSTVVLTGMQAWVIVRLGVGFLREGEAFASSPECRRWSEPPESFPGVLEIVSEYRARWRRGAMADDKSSAPEPSQDGVQQDDDAEGGEAPTRHADLQHAARAYHLSTSQRRTRAKSRRANRAARTARRARR